MLGFVFEFGDCQLQFALSLVKCITIGHDMFVVGLVFAFRFGFDIGMMFHLGLDLEMRLWLVLDFV